jgi:hypothetical protein
MTNGLSRRSILKLGALAPVAGALASTQIPTAAAAATGTLPTVVPSRKKGVGVAQLAPQGAYRVQSMNPAWYYTWAADGIDAVQNVEFVPMVWGGTNIQTQIDDVQALGPGKRPIVLGCNEPDGAAQSNMTVAEVLQWWPQISDLAARTVAPAPVNPFDSWYTEFVQQAAALGLRWNYVAVHNYPGADAAGFLSTIDQVYETYGLPIWITEFAVADWTATTPGTNQYSAEQVLEFMTAVLPELERRPYVARYAWFGAGPAAATSVKLGPSALFDTAGDMTALGQFYSQFGTGVSAAAASAPVQAGGAG